MTYAIIRHRLLDIRLVISRSIIYFFLVLFVAAMFALVIVLTGIFFQDVLGVNTFLITFIISVLIVSFLEPLKRWLSRSTDAIFFKAKINYPILLRDLSEIIATEIEIDTLIEKLTQKLNSGLKIHHSILILKNNNQSFQVRTLNHPHTESLNFGPDNFLIRYLEQKDKIIVLEELQREIEDAFKKEERSKLEKIKEEMEKTRAAAVAPIKTRKNFNALLLLGPKLSGDILNHEEIEMIETLTSQIASAIEKSKLYEEVKSFTETLQKKIDEATRDIKQKNIHLEKLLKMRSEFLDITSHQLRTPTSVLIGILEMATSGDLDKLPKEKKKKHLSGAYLKARKLEQIVSDLLRASELDSAPFELEPGDFKEINLKEFLVRLAESKSLEAEKQGVKVILKKPLPVKKIFGEERFLDEGVGNLLDNAIKYTPAVNEKTQEKGKIILSAEKKGNEAVIKISDNGIGIPKDEIKKLFEKFARATNAKEMYTDGTGLGLFIAKEIVKGHHGQVSVESEMGKGTTFSVRLPLRPYHG